MSLEIRRIAPIRAANVVSVFYFILFALFSIPMVFIVGDMPAQQNIEPAQQAVFTRVMWWLMLAYPIFGAVFGWLFTALGAVIYNALTPRLGGVLLEVGDTSASTSGATA